MIISRSVLLEREMSQTKFAEKVETYFRSNMLLVEKRADCEIMRKNIMQPDRP